MKKNDFKLIIVFLAAIICIACIYRYHTIYETDIRNVFDEMIKRKYDVIANAEQTTAGGYDAFCINYSLQEGTPLKIGMIYSREYKKLYLYGDADMPENIQDMSYQEYFEKCLSEYGVTWEMVEDCKEEFLCEKILGPWFENENRHYTKDNLGELEVIDYLLPYEYCGIDNSDNKIVIETVEEGYQGAFRGKLKYAIWDNVFSDKIQCIQQDRDYGFHDIMERIDADINGFHTLNGKIVMEWDDNIFRYDSVYALMNELGMSDFVEWLISSGNAQGNLTKLSYSREEGERKTQEMLEACPLGKLKASIKEADFYFEGEYLHIRLPYYDYEADNPDWLENGRGELWQGWLSVKIEEFRKFVEEKYSGYFMEK